jgi:glycosyltransferase involved in cell wall biosynthesis
VRIAWVTAFAARSGIGRFSQAVAPALAEHADVHLWTVAEPDLLEAELPVFLNPDAERLQGYDAVVYNMGSTLHPHGRFYELSQQVPGVVLLDDRVLPPMFVAKWRGPGGFIAPAYFSSMSELYGESGLRVALDSVSGARQPPIWVSADVDSFPLVEVALHRAIGAVTHSQAAARSIVDRWFGPVRALRFPAYPQLIDAGAASGALAPPRRDGRLQLTAVGHVNANKRPDQIVRILAADAELGSRFHFSIAGPLDTTNSYSAELAALIAKSSGVSAEPLGWLDDLDLHRLMAATDIFLNLRHPALESASASLLFELCFGRPVVCFETSGFADLPSDAVVRVGVEDYDEIAVQLKALAGDPERRRRIGERARRYASEQDVEAYARHFAAFVREALDGAARLRLIDRVATELGAMDVDDALAVFDHVAAEIARIA